MDLTLNEIDYQWVNETNDHKKLKYALKILQEDGGYFPDLERAIKVKIHGNSLDDDVVNKEKTDITKDILNWEQNINRIDKNLKSKESSQASAMNEEVSKKKQAEKLKMQGNDHMKAKDFLKAIEYYSKSIEIDNTESTTYSNRAQAYFKINEFNKSIEDCNKATDLTPNYSKAIFRRACCFKELKDYSKAYKELNSIFKEFPDNEEVNKMLIEVEKLMADNKNDDKSKSKFKKIKITEETVNEEESNKQVNTKPIEKKQEIKPTETKSINKIEATEVKTVKPVEKEPNPKEDEKTVKTKKIQVDENKINQAIELAKSDSEFTYFKKNSTGFEQAISSFKTNPSRFYDFLHYFSAETFKLSYEKNDISFENMLFLIKSMKENEIRIKENSVDYKLTVDYLKSLEKTRNFNLKKMMMKSKKSEFSFLSDLIQDEELIKRLFN